MKSKLLQSFDTLEKVRRQKIEQLSQLDPAKLKKNPALGGWSTAQVFQHLYTAERASLAYLNKKIQSDELPPAGLKSHYRMLLLHVMLSGILRFKAPKGVGDPENQDFDHTVVQWDQVRKDLRKFLEEAPDEKLERALYKHPVVGRLTMQQTLTFFRVHMLHHWKQVDRTLAQVDKE